MHIDFARRVTLRKFSFAIITATIFITLTGCVSSQSITQPEPSEKGIAPTSAVSPTAESKAASSFAWEKLNKSCSSYISSTDVFNYNSNFSIDSQQQFPGSIYPASIGGITGVECIYANQSSRDTIYVSIGKVSEAQKAQLKTAVGQAGTAVNGLPSDVSGSWTIMNSRGTLVISRGTYALVAASTTFTNPGDAREFVANAIEHLN